MPHQWVCALFTVLPLLLHRSGSGAVSNEGALIGATGASPKDDVSKLGISGAGAVSGSGAAYSESEHGR